MKRVVTDEDVLSGNPRLDGTRIGVVHVYRRYESGETPEEIASSYDGVTVADVHRALAFAFDNPEEMQRLDTRGGATVARIREERPVDPEEFEKRV